MENVGENEHNFSAKALYDIKLVERALQHNDQKAYTELMKRYEEPVYFMLLRMMSNKDDAEDLTIEAFGKAFSNLSQYSTRYAFSTWLFKIASNNAIDFIRKNKEHRGLASLNVSYDEDGSEELSAYIKGHGLNPEESIIKKQAISQIRALIEKLKPNYRIVIELFYMEELSLEEISKQLNIPENTVKVRLFRARDLLLPIVKRNKNIK
ncbi:MAG: sigma-70 family RNA polymerase sigma factor [Bacteroidetes bacterium]|nr:sigma-70 family RNA polymerase sigma factor [Bacteroidota bacterium]